MHVEFRNTRTMKSYYLCYDGDDLSAIAYNPDVRNHLTNLDAVLTVGQLYDHIRPVVDRLTAGNNDRWEVSVFYFKMLPIHSLTESPVHVMAKYAVGDTCILNGVRQKTQFHPIY